MAAKFFARRTRNEASTPVQWDEPILKYKFEGHDDTILSFVFLHDNVHIVSGSWDGTMRKWNCDTGLLVGEPWEGQGGSIYSLALSPDGKVIACGRVDGSVQQWNTDGEMITGVWTGDGKVVRSLSWSPIGDHIASGSDDGKFLIRNAEDGKVKVGPIKTEQSYVCSLAYSPLGNRIASGGSNKTICVWCTKTGKLVVGPIQGLGNIVTSLAWSSDSTKLYSASDEFARVFRSKSGVLLNQLKHDNYLYSSALSPNNNVLACVGNDGVVQLWDTKSHQPLSLLFRQDDHKWLNCVSFSPDGRYLAYSGDDKNLTLWMIKDHDVAPRLTAVRDQGHGQLEATQRDARPEQQQGTRPQSPSPSFLDADATGGDGIVEEWHNDPYVNFFKSSQLSLPATTSSPPQSPDPSSARHFWNTISQYSLSSILLRKFFARRARSNSPLQPATTKPNQSMLEGKVPAGKEEGEKDDDRCSVNYPLGASKDKGRQQDEPSADVQNLPLDDPRPFANESTQNIWKRLMQARGKVPTDTKIAPAMKRPEVVEVYAVRGFQRYVIRTPTRKATLPAVTYSAPLPAAHIGGSPQPLSLHEVTVQAGLSSHATVGNGARYFQPTGGHSLQVSPSHFITNYHTSHDCDSRSSIEGSCNKFLDKICFPCGHYHKDS